MKKKCNMKKILKKGLIYSMSVFLAFSQPLSMVVYAEDVILEDTEETTDYTDDEALQEEIPVEAQEAIVDDLPEFIQEDIELTNLENEDNAVEEAETQEVEALTETDENADILDGEFIDEAKEYKVTLEVCCKDGSITKENSYIRANNHVQIELSGDLYNSKEVAGVMLELLVNGETTTTVACTKEKGRYVYDTSRLGLNQSYNFNIKKISVIDFDGNELASKISTDVNASTTIMCACETDIKIEGNKVYLHDEDDLFDQYGNPVNVFGKWTVWNVDVTNAANLDVDNGYYEAVIDSSSNGEFVVDFHNNESVLNRKYKIALMFNAWGYYTHAVEKEFIIDKANPEARFEVYTDGTKIDEVNGKYFSNNITVKVIVNEYNVDKFLLIDNNSGLILADENNLNSNDSVPGEYYCDIQLERDGDYDLEIFCKDKVGRSIGETPHISFTIDKTAPKVEIKYGNVVPKNGYYYNSDRTVEIIVDDKNFNTEDHTFIVNSKYGNTVNLGNWSVDSDGNYTCSAVFQGDDEYSGSFECIDKAGNKSNVIDIEKFVVDKTAPKIDYSYDNNSARNTNYYNAGRTARITVSDISFDSKLVGFENNSNQSVSLSSWSGNGNSFSASVECTADGKYQFYIYAEDLAGNKSERIDCGMFIVDTVDPIIEITGVTDQSANAGTVIPVVNFKDINLNDNNSVVSINGYKNGLVNPSNISLSEGSGKNVTYDVFGVEKVSDDVYIINVVAEDMAGNKSELSYMFSVNRFGSTFGVTQKTAELVDKYYTNAEQDLVLLETNVDNLVEQDIYITKNGKNTKLVKDVDYFVEKEGTEATWKAYTYTIKKSNFSEEGVYEVSLFTKDKAGNQSDSNAKGMSVKFAVDKTAPSIVVAGIKDDNIYEADKLDISLDIQDNMEMGYAEILINDEVVKKYEADELTDLVTYSINESMEPITVVVRAVDIVGNLSEKKYENVVISTVINDSIATINDNTTPLSDEMEVGTRGMSEELLTSNNGAIDDVNSNVNKLFTISILSIIGIAAIGIAIIAIRRKKY